MQLNAVLLEGQYINLEPVSADMREELRAALDCDVDAWAIQFANGRGEGFPDYWENMISPISRSGRIGFAVRLRSTGRFIGTTSFHHMSPQNRTVEIGSTFFRPEARGTVVNLEAKILLLDYAFRQGALRVQFTVDSRNERSQAAVAKLGATREGVLRCHLVTWTGHRRNTVVFSIIGEEWENVRKQILSQIAEARAI